MATCACGVIQYNPYLNGVTDSFAKISTTNEQIWRRLRGVVASMIVLLLTTYDWFFY
jgi:hypothetical protein